MRRDACMADAAVEQAISRSAAPFPCANTRDFNQLTGLSNQHAHADTHAHTLSVEWTQAAAAEECYLKSPLLLSL